MTDTSKRSELLMPAGNLQKLKIAILYGADAVYMGTPDMSLRTKSEFTLEQVVEGVEFAHQYGKKAYLTLNLFAHNKDIGKLDEYISTVRSVKPDGLIIADPGIFEFVRQKAPELELHVSTQANICSWLAVDFWKKQGAGLCVMARELSFAEIKEIREKCPDTKMEIFIHGAMCMTYSGRCMLSNYMVERGANQGNCANSCRWQYKVHMKLKDGSIHELDLNEHTKEMFDFFLEEGYREGELMPIEENERGTYILNAKDLCLMPKLDQYLEIGIDSLKVEGRNKSQYYVGLVARAYRKAIDDWYKDPHSWNPKAYMKELESVQNRGFSLGFHEGRLTNLAHNYEDTHSLAEYEFAGLVLEVNEDHLLVQVKNKLIAGDVLEFVIPGSDEIILLRMYRYQRADNNNFVEEISPGQQPTIKISYSLFDHEDVDRLKSVLVPLTIIKEEKLLTDDEIARLKLDKQASKMELAAITENTITKYNDKLAALQNAIDHKEEGREPRSTRNGINGCCGKGCNGCLVFWYDKTYARARGLLLSKKQGSMLNKSDCLIEKIA